jgi:hypothetical protein
MRDTEGLYDTASYQNSEADSRSKHFAHHMSIDEPSLYKSHHGGRTSTPVACPPRMSFSASVRLFLGRAVFAIFIGLVSLVIFSNNLSHRKGTTNVNGADSGDWMDELNPIMTLKGRSTGTSDHYIINH